MWVVYGFVGFKIQSKGCRDFGVKLTLRFRGCPDQRCDILNPRNEKH